MLFRLILLFVFFSSFPLAWSEDSFSPSRSAHLVQEVELSFVPSTVQFVFMDENGVLEIVDGLLREDKNRSVKLRAGGEDKGHWYAYTPAMNKLDLRKNPSLRVAVLFYDGGRVGHIAALKELTGEILTLAHATSEELGEEISELRATVLQLRGRQKSVEADYIRTRKDVALIGDLDKIEHAKEEEERLREAIEQVKGDVQSLSELVQEAREEEQPKRFHIRERTLKNLMDQLVKKQKEAPSNAEGGKEESPHMHNSADLSNLRQELVELRNIRKNLEQR